MKALEAIKENKNKTFWDETYIKDLERLKYFLIENELNFYLKRSYYYGADSSYYENHKKGHIYLFENCPVEMDELVKKLRQDLEDIEITIDENLIRFDLKDWEYDL